MRSISAHKPNPSPLCSLTLPNHICVRPAPGNLLDFQLIARTHQTTTSQPTHGKPAATAFRMSTLGQRTSEQLISGEGGPNSNAQLQHLSPNRPASACRPCVTGPEVTERTVCHSVASILSRCTAFVIPATRHTSRGRDLWLDTAWTVASLNQVPKFLLRCTSHQTSDPQRAQPLAAQGPRQERFCDDTCTTRSEHALKIM